MTPATLATLAASPWLRTVLLLAASLDHLCAGLCLVGAVDFIFRGT